MAKAKVECTCKKCGKSFIREKNCRNSADRFSWEKWMRENYNGLCSACYQADRDAKAAKGTSEIRMPYGEYKLRYAECRTKSGSYDKSTKTIIVFVPQIRR